jgi:hypothetical protein
MQLAGGHLEGHHAPALAILHHEVDGEEFDEEVGLVLQRLLVQRVQHGVAGAICRRAGALCGALAEIGRHSTEGPLVNPSVFSPRERHAVVLEFHHGGGGLLAHVLDGILVAEPVRALDRVVHVPAPVVLAHVAKSRADAALGRDGVTARGKNLREAGRGQARLGQTHRRA